MPLAVAVSGGADSMALCLLAAEYAQGNIVALTVDHGLRAESAAEAGQVAEWMRAHQIEHHVLTWEKLTSPPPIGARSAGGRREATSCQTPPPPRPSPYGGGSRKNLQAAAREARYALMAEFCRARGIRHLLVAHTREDQAETVLLRLKRGSHVTGLAAMQSSVERDGITLLRPLLTIAKSRLIATLQAQNQPWIEDPSNDNEHFDRVRLRKLLAALPERDAIISQLAETAVRLQPLKVAAEQATQTLLAAHAEVEDDGAQCAFDALEAAGVEIAVQVLKTLIQRVGKLEYPPRFAEVEALYEALVAAPGRRTLGGCLVERRGRLLSIRPERLKPAAA